MTPEQLRCFDTVSAAHGRLLTLHALIVAAMMGDHSSAPAGENHALNLEQLLDTEMDAIKIGLRQIQNDIDDKGSPASKERASSGEAP